MQITKAIIAAAGFGTRWLPYTKSIEKWMLPVMTRPIIDYVVQDCLAAGIEEIIFVVNKKHDQLEQYYSDNLTVEKYLKDKGRRDLLPKLDTIARNIKLSYVVQEADAANYGTAVPVWLNRSLFRPDEHFAYFASDAFFYRSDGSSELGAAIETLELARADAVILAMNVGRENVEKYGILKMREEAGAQVFEAIIEKPKLEDAPSTLANAADYILPGTIFKVLEQLMQSTPSNKEGEFYITDAINMLAGTEKVVVHEAKGVYLDGGTPENWLASLNHIYNNR